MHQSTEFLFFDSVTAMKCTTIFSQLLKCTIETERNSSGVRTELPSERKCTHVVLLVDDPPIFGILFITEQIE